MTKEEAISELVVIKSVYSHMRGEYKPCVEALQMAIDLLKQADTPQTDCPCNTCANKGDHDGECKNCVADSAPIRWKTPSHYKPKDEPQTETEIAKAIVHKMIDDAVIAEDAYPDLRQRMHDAVERLDEYYPSEDERSE